MTVYVVCENSTDAFQGVFWSEEEAREHINKFLGDGYYVIDYEMKPTGK